MKKKPLIIVIAILAVLVVCCAVCGSSYWWITQQADLSDADQEKLAEAIGEALNIDEEEIKNAFSNNTDGFEHVTCNNLNLSTSMPDGWYKAEEEEDGTQACLLTKEMYSSTELFETGFTVNLLSDYEATYSAPASAFANEFITIIASQYDGTVDSVTIGQGYDGYATTVLLADGNSSIKVYYASISDDEADTVYTFWFESPEEEWDTAWEIAEIMFDDLELNN